MVQNVTPNASRIATAKRADHVLVHPCTKNSRSPCGGRLRRGGIDWAGGGTTSANAAGFFSESGRVGRTERRWSVLRARCGALAARRQRSGASVHPQRRRPAADFSDCRSFQSESEALGEGAHEEGYRRGARREEKRLYAAVKLRAGGRSLFHGLWRTGPSRIPANAEGSLDRLAGGQSGPEDLHGGAALGKPEAVMVRRIGRPLRRKYPCGRHDRPE